MRELNAALTGVQTDEAVRSVIITGAGREDLLRRGRSRLGVLGRRTSITIRFRQQRHAEDRALSQARHRRAERPRHGRRCEIAMACHLRLLKETARMGQTEVEPSASSPATAARSGCPG